MRSPRPVPSPARHMGGIPARRHTAARGRGVEALDMNHTPASELPVCWWRRLQPGNPTPDRLPLRPRHRGCHGAQQDSARAVPLVVLASRQWSCSRFRPLVGVVDDCASRLSGPDAQIPTRSGLVKRLRCPRPRAGRKANTPLTRAGVLLFFGFFSPLALSTWLSETTRLEQAGRRSQQNPVVVYVSPICMYLRNTGVMYRTRSRVPSPTLTLPTHAPVPWVLVST